MNSHHALPDLTQTSVFGPCSRCGSPHGQVVAMLTGEVFCFPCDDAEEVDVARRVKAARHQRAVNALADPKTQRATHAGPRAAEAYITFRRAQLGLPTTVEE